MTQPAVAHAPPDLARRFAATLDRLRADHALSYLKLGTEAEALSFEEVALLRRVVDEHCASPVRFVGKIGGPDARNDLYQFDLLGVEGFVGPMVESAYGLQIYLEAVALMVPSRGPGLPYLGINVETHQAVANLDAMLAVDGVDRLAFMNVGRSDLSASVGQRVDDPDVTDMTCEVITKAQAAGLSGHVGGCVTSTTLAPVLERVQPDGFHTRFLAFRLEPGAPVDERVGAALEAELELLELLAAASEARREMHVSRLEVTRKRMGR